MEKQISMEEWKPIPDYEEYQVSTLGRVKRLAYYKNVCGGSKQYCKERILKPQKRKRGYQAVMKCRRIYMEKDLKDLLLRDLSARLELKSI